MSYQVKLTVFEGPLDLLLQLIERRELDITTVSLAAVTDQYLEHISLMSDVPADALAEFLVIAAKLILIKSQALLPRPPAPEEQQDEDVGEDLARQLQEYKRFKEIAALLKERDDNGLHCYLRLASTGITPRLQLEGVTIADLAAAMRRALTALPEETPTPAMARRQFTIGEKIAAIEGILSTGKATFSQILRQVTSRLEAIVTFLALLELIKQGRAVVEQAEIFGEIMIAPGVAVAAATPELQPQ